MKRSEIIEAAATISRILGSVRGGTLDASGPVANAVVRRLEGAQVALESAAKVPPLTRDKAANVETSETPALNHRRHKSASKPQ